MTRHVEVLRGELPFLLGFFAHDDGHLGALHPFEAALECGAPGFGGGLRDAAEERLDLRLPEPVHLVEHPHGGEHAFAEIAALREMRHDIARDGFEPVVTLDDFQLGRELPLQFFLLRLVEIRLLEQLVEIVAERVVLDQHLGHPLLIKERDRRAIVHALLEIVFRHVVAEPPVGLSVAAEERCAGKGEVGAQLLAFLGCAASALETVPVSRKLR